MITSNQYFKESTEPDLLTQNDLHIVTEMEMKLLWLRDDLDHSQSFININLEEEKVNDSRRYSRCIKSPLKN